MSAPERKQRLEMVARTIEARGIREPEILSAMRTVPRHEFVPPEERAHAYEDRPLPIGHRQTISQPYVVALLVQLCELRGGENVLEIGTGSGYQAAVLAEIADRVYTIEIVEPIARRAAETLARLRYDRVLCRYGDGAEGWAGVGPFDAIVVTAAPKREVPAPLVRQLRDGGRLVAPVGDDEQRLLVIERTGNRFRRSLGAPVRFVPLTGQHAG